MRCEISQTSNVKGQTSLDGWDVLSRIGVPLPWSIQRRAAGALIVLSLAVLIMGGLSGCAALDVGGRSLTQVKAPWKSGSYNSESKMPLSDEAALSAAGFIEAEEIALAPEVGGRITAICVEAGQRVAAGQWLVQLDDRVAQARVVRAQAKLAEARAQLEMAMEGVMPDELRVAEARLTQAEAARWGACRAWQDAQLILENPQELDRQIAVARAQVNVTQATVNMANAYKDVAAIGQNLFETGRETLNELPDKVTLFDGGVDDLPIEIPPEIGDVIENPIDGTYTYGDYEVIIQDGHITANRYLDYSLPTQAHLAPNNYWQAWVGVNSAQAGHDGARQALGLLYAIRDNPYQIQAEVDKAQAQCREAEAQRAMALAQLDALRQGASEEEIAALRALVQQAEAELQQAQVALAQLTLYAPLNGLVLERVLEVGELAAPSVPVLTLVNLDKVQLQVYIPNEDLGSVSLGQPVKICVDAALGEGESTHIASSRRDKRDPCAFTGVVTYIGQEAEFPPQNVPKEDERAALSFAVRLQIDNPQSGSESAYLLKPGMSAEAHFSSSPSDH